MGKYSQWNAPLHSKPNYLISCILEDLFHYVKPWLWTVLTSNDWWHWTQDLWIFSNVTELPTTLCTVDIVSLHVTALEARHLVFSKFCECAHTCACVGVCVGGSQGKCCINLVCASHLFGLFKCDTWKNSLLKTWGHYFHSSRRCSSPRNHIIIKLLGKIGTCEFWVLITLNFNSLMQ